MNPTLKNLSIVVLLIFFLTGCAAQSSNGTLAASGTVETTQVVIASEISGKVLEVLVEEGDTVSTGDVLIRLDDSLLQAQRSVAAASLETAEAAAATADAAVASAQAQYDTALANALNAEKASRLQDWMRDAPGDFEQPAWFFNREEQLDSAETSVQSAQAQLNDAIEKLDFIESKAASEAFIESERALSDARTIYLLAEQLLDSASDARDGALLDEAQAILDDALTELEDAQNAYDENLTTEGADDVLQARARVLVAQELYDLAQDHLRSLQTGELSPGVVAAQKVLEQAQAAADQAHTAVNQAQASLDLLDVQLSRTVITATTDGVVLNRMVEPGGMAISGGSALVLGHLDELTLTVYVPEDRLGEISLGQPATVTVDSFPGEVFDATVSQIASEAEFTPRNVQTVEGRTATVFAVELELADTNGRLKPGMPADVTFGQP